ncbi:MAG: hypothetical protein V4630_16425, partial [Pseudomonadota bacterium]
MIVVDWSAANLPTSLTNRANAVWIGCHDAEGGAEWHHRTRAGAEAQLLTLIDSMLNLAKLESGRLELHPRAVDLPPLLRDVLDMLQPDALRKHIAVV